MSAELLAPVWRLAHDAIIESRAYQGGATMRTWAMPPNLIDLELLNATARIMFAYFKRAHLHPLCPRTANGPFGIFLPGCLLFGSSMQPLVEIHEEMPRYENAGTSICWPTTYTERYDTPLNEAAERVLLYWRENKSRRAELGLVEHSPWCAIRGSLFLPSLRKIERPEESLPAYVGAPKPSPKYVPHDGSRDGQLVPERAASPTIRPRRLGETHAVQRGESDPHGRR